MRLRAARRPLVHRVCDICQAPFTVTETAIGRGRGKHCSRACYYAFRRTLGSPVSVRFWENVSKADGCWEWTGFRDPNGYGRLSVADEKGRRPVLAHRLSWELAFGSIPDGAGVLHRCDNPPCVRPDHLFLGDQKANMIDCSQKKRTTFGERSTSARLDANQVREIRERYAEGTDTYQSLAATYGVGAATIADVVARRTWRHIK